MAMIAYNEAKQIFQLDTPGSSYCIGLVDGKYAAHLYYGRRLPQDADVSYLLRLHEYVQPPSERPGEKTGFFEKLPQEYPSDGLGDYREPCLAARGMEGGIFPELVLKSWSISGKTVQLPLLPSCFGNNAETLELLLCDEVTGLEASLFYTVFEDADVVVRSARIRNGGEAPVFLRRALSACLELPAGKARTLTFGGTWAKEHIPVWRQAGEGGTVSESRRGAPGHGGQPFMALQYEDGDIFAMHLVYSGSYLAKLGQDAFGDYRMVLGIHPDCFEWKLEKGEVFYTPEAVLSFAENLDGMTHVFHDFYRRHLIRDVGKPRPILINNWEATYFDFDERRILSIAKAAADAGIEMFVLDDGWFGEGRMTAEGSLGDWTASRRKLPGGLERLSAELKKTGLLPGLWFEPEMISERSLLYREHPEWVMREPGRKPGLCRHQWMLDFSNPEVREYVFQSIARAVRAGDVRYIKWDMNRTLTDTGSSFLPADRQMELMHRHVLGVYEVQERIRQEFPELLLENCASGGARFDPGMLYYSPQIWCSDNMDPLDRMEIHEGTAMLYPLSAIGSHVPKSPNDITGRRTPLAARAVSAMFGTFGYELDITALSREEREELRGQVNRYRRIRPYIMDGDYYRLMSAFDSGFCTAYEVVSKDGLGGFVVFMQKTAPPNGRSVRIRFKGLCPDRNYVLEGEEYSGDILMKAGYLFPYRKQDYYSEIIEFHARQ